MNEVTNKDRRRFSRIPFVGDVILQNALSATTWICQLIDISLAGALLNCPVDFPGTQGQEFQLTIKLGDGEIAIVMMVNVAHRQQQRIGLLCQRIDADSVTHLRRLVELNLGDADLAQRELQHLAYKFHS